MNLKKFVLCSLSVIAIMAISAVAFAQEADPTAVAVAKIDASKWIAIAAGFGIAIAAFGGALGQGKAASTALEGIARNPNAADKMGTPMILGLALIESLVIYALIISILLVTLKM